MGAVGEYSQTAAIFPHGFFLIIMFWSQNSLFLNLQNAAEPVAATETLAEVPEHVLRGLPEEVRLFPSAVDKTRIGEC